MTDLGCLDQLTLHQKRMGFFLEIVLLIVATGLLVTATFLISRAALALLRLRLLVNSEMRQAFGWAISGTVVGLLGILALVFVTIEAFAVVSQLSNIINLIIIGLVAYIGVASALAARRMTQSRKFDDVEDTAYRDALWSAVFSLGVAGLVVLVFLINIIRDVDRSNKERKEKEKRANN